MHPVFRKLALGTVQFGMPYGITNNRGIPSQKVIQAILESAADDGLAYLDTAQAYGDSEAVIGSVEKLQKNSNLKIVTKLSPNAHQWAEKEVLDSIRASLARLNRECIHSVLVHRSEHLAEPSVLAAAQTAMEIGLIQRFGASVSSPEEFLRAIEIPLVTMIQLPFHLLDWRWLTIDFNAIRAAHPNLIIHARSPFLQGALLTKDLNQWPKTNMNTDHAVFTQLQDFLKTHAHIPPHAIFLGYVLKQPWIDQVIFGAQDLAQYASNLGGAIRGFEISEELIESFKRFSIETNASLELLSPSLWKKT
jgi:aryl-alcohol dehydrogenase-like predicted oxidoreductase